MQKQRGNVSSLKKKTMKIRKNANGTYTVNSATDREMLQLILSTKRRKKKLNDNWGLAVFDVFTGGIDEMEGMTYREIISELNSDV